MQSSIALSSGESEYCALLRCAAHALGIKAMLIDWHYGVKCEIHVLCDSSAARGMSAGQGLRKTRHVDVRFLWLPGGVQEGRLKVLNLSLADADRCCRCMNVHMGNVGSSLHRNVVDHKQ